ncbi:MAG: UDP-N-acetylmuramate dehydrogenase [bacterium]|nr:MAG: UDP-N-acetylmuramate dehydrogenase [bacterium]
MTKVASARDRILGKLRRRIKGTVLPSESLSKHTTYRIGGDAEILASAADSDDAAAVYRFARREGIPLTVLGAGSNVIAPDDGIEGIVLKLENPHAAIRFSSDGTVHADAGVPVLVLARTAAKKGLGGLVPIAGVPGTVGGAVLMNARVDKEDTASLLVSVEVLTSSGKRRTFRRNEIPFGYRTSIFKGSDWMILRAVFDLHPGDPIHLLEEIEHEWNTWRANFPLEPPNAGSVFKRPPGDYAGRLIEEAGCKGLRVGGAVVSDRHANFILNTGDATAADIYELISEVRRRTYEKTGVYLELEQIPLDSSD